MMEEGPWQRMDAQHRRSFKTLAAGEVPEGAGVYAVYRDGRRMYVGKANSLRSRIWGNHSGRGAVMTGSALRRNVAEHLGIGSAADIKARRIQPTADQVAEVRSWLDECSIAWMECQDAAAAVTLEIELKAVFKPPLTKT